MTQPAFPTLPGERGDLWNSLESALSEHVSPTDLPLVVTGLLQDWEVLGLSLSGNGWLDDDPELAEALWDLPAFATHSLTGALSGHTLPGQEEEAQEAVEEILRDMGFHEWLEEEEDED